MPGEDLCWLLWLWQWLEPRMLAHAPPSLGTRMFFSPAFVSQKRGISPPGRMYTCYRAAVNHLGSLDGASEHRQLVIAADAVL